MDEEREGGRKYSGAMDSRAYVCAFVDKTAQLDAIDRKSLRMVFKDETRLLIPLPLPALRSGPRQAN